jgi:hypothetical protein
MFGFGQAAAASGGYTATWIILSHSGTFENQSLTGLPLLRSAAADAKTPGIEFKCYRPPGYEFTSVFSNIISHGSTVTNFGMTLTVAHNAACNADDKGTMFNTIARDLTKLDELAQEQSEPKVTYKLGGQVVIDPPENKTIFMHPMSTDAQSKTGRDSRPAAGLSEFFPGLGLYLLEVYHTDTGRPVDASALDPLLVPYILGRRCRDKPIHAITATTIGPDPRIGIRPDLFELLKTNRLPQYYLDARFRSETPSAKNHVSDFEIFRGGENSTDIQEIMAKNCSVMDEDEYNAVMYNYANGVTSKRIRLFDLKKVCKLLLPRETTKCELFDIGCKDLYPNPPLQFAVQVQTWPRYRHSDDSTESAGSLHSYKNYELTSEPDDSTVASKRFIGPHALTSRQYALQAARLAYPPQSAQQGPPPRGARDGYPPPGGLVHGYRGRRSSRSPPPRGELPPREGGKKTKTRRVKRNKSRNFRNKSRFRRTRRRVIKRKNK